MSDNEKLIEELRGVVAVFGDMNPIGNLARRAERALSRAAAPEPEWEYAWLADEDARQAMRPRGPRIMMDEHPFTPEEAARFPRGQRVRRRKAGPWTPVDGEK